VLGLITSLSTRSLAQSGDDARAPFGLTWGASLDDVQKLGVRLTALEGRSNFGATYSATQMSRVLNDAENVVLSFGHRDKLWRIAVVSTHFGPDPAGAQVIARYADLAGSLAERYGRGAETDIRDRDVWKGPNEYVMSIHQGRAQRFTSFQGASVDVELSVRAKGSDMSYYLILFEHRSGADEFERDRKAKEKDAL
jgi:hypothetical protein